MPRRFREDCTSDSELADSTIDPFEQQSETELDHPTPISLSDSDAPSPILYRNERANAAAAVPRAAPPIDRKSEKEDSEDCEIIEMEEIKAPQRIVASKIRATDQVLANFLNATRQFADTLEDLRREDLMLSRRKFSRKSLDFEDVQTPSRVQRQETTPPRRPVQLSDKRGMKRRHAAAGSCRSFLT